MSFKTLEAEYQGRTYRIEEDYPEVGVYLYVYENDQCVNDYLQNNIDTCKELAFEKFEVPLCSWEERILPS